MIWICIAAVLLAASGGVLIWFAPPPDLILPQFALAPMFALIAAALSLALCGVAAVLLARREKYLRVLVHLGAYAVFSLMGIVALLYAARPALAFLSALLALGFCAAGARGARRMHGVAAILLILPLLLSVYAVALTYAISMMNP